MAVTSDPLSRYLVNRTSRVNRRERLRLMTAGELLDMSLSVYQRLGWTILKLTALPSLFCLASVAFLWLYVLPGLGLTSHPGDVKAQVEEAALGLLIGVSIGGPLFLIGLSYSSGAIVSLVSDFMLGRTPSAEAAGSAGIRSIRRLFLLSLFEVVIGWSGVLAATGLLMVSALLPEGGSSDMWAALASGFAVMGFLIGGFSVPAVLTRHALAPAAAVIESLGPVASAKRSVQLMRGTPWQPSGYSAAWTLIGVILLLVVLLLPGFSSTLEAAGLNNEIRVFVGIPFLSSTIAAAIGLLPLFLAIWTLVPVWCVGATILYYERRVRKEGFDIETLAQDVWKGDRRSRFEI